MGRLRGVTVLALVIVALFCGAASADTLTVCSSGCDYTRIQDAVDAAGAGDTIVVQSGSYVENVWINNKDLTIRGEDRETTIIDGGGGGNCIRVNSADVIISGFTIQNAESYGVYAYSLDLNINNATITDCGGDAIYFSCGKSLTQNTANSNTGNGGDGAVGGIGGDGHGYGIYLNYSSSITHAGNTASLNRGYGGSGSDGLEIDDNDGHGYSYNQPWNDPPPLQKGDLNSDGILTPADAAIALRIAATGAHDDTANVSGDGCVTSLDALMILQAAAGAIEL